MSESRERLIAEILDLSQIQAKRAMMDYIAERMEKASLERVHMLYICAINILD